MTIKELLLEKSLSLVKSDDYLGLAVAKCPEGKVNILRRAYSPRRKKPDNWILESRHYIDETTVLEHRMIGNALVLGWPEHNEKK